MRSIRYFCLQHGPFLVECDIRVGRRAPLWQRCPVSGCGWKSRTVHRRKKSGHSISVPYATIELLRAEAQRRGTSMRALVEGYTKDCK